MSEDSASCPFSALPPRIYLREPPTSFDQHNHSLADLTSCVTPLLKRGHRGTGILNPLSITYAFRPRLRDRLTLGGRTFPRKPWDSGGRDSRPAFRYSCPHNRFHPVHRRLPSGFTPEWNAPLPHLPFGRHPQRRQLVLVPIIFGARSLDKSAITHCLNDGCL